MNFLLIPILTSFLVVICFTAAIESSAIEEEDLFKKIYFVTL